MNKLLIVSILLRFSCAREFRDKEDIVLSILSKNVVGKTSGLIWVIRRIT